MWNPLLLFWGYIISVLASVCNVLMRLFVLWVKKVDIFFLGVMMLLNTVKEFCETTSVHGLSFIVNTKSSLIKRIAWGVIFFISLSYAGFQLKKSIDGKLTSITLFVTENECQKTKPVPIQLPRSSRNFPNVKTRNNFFFHNWTSKIIPFIRFGMQMDRTKNFFWDVKSCIFYSYPTFL